MQRILITVIVIAVALGLAGCGGTTSSPSGQKKEDGSRQSNYDRLVENQPAHSMSYSPTRATKNFWIDTWNKKGKLSYVYLMNSSGNVFGYFVFKGLPVSYCTSLIPPYQIKRGDGGSNGGYQYNVVPGPSVDGTYASSSNCSEFYGKDATSGAYMEYSVGMGINQLVFDQPMSQYGAADPLGDAKVKR